MSSPKPRTLAELQAAAEKRKHDAIRARLGIPSELHLSELELESLAYHLSERSGEVEVKWEGHGLRVGEPGRPAGLLYKGDAARFLLVAWNVTLETAKGGVRFKVQDGKRI
jgi:hypothetical protein